jgi:hypothetical protein
VGAALVSENFVLARYFKPLKQWTSRSAARTMRLRGGADKGRTSKLKKTQSSVSYFLQYYIDQ